MKKELTGPAGSSRKKAPREIGPSSAAPRPVEREPEEVVFNHTTLGGVFNRQRDLAASGPRRGRWTWTVRTLRAGWPVFLSWTAWRTAGGRSARAAGFGWWFG